jgi:hypothetical protein
MKYPPTFQNWVLENSSESSRDREELIFGNVKSPAVKTYSSSKVKTRSPLGEDI